MSAPIDGHTFTPTQIAAATAAGISIDAINPLLTKPLYKFSESEIGLYARFLQIAMPSLRQRVVHLASKNIGQPVELYLLGESPFESFDPQPIYSIKKSDCVVFVEQTYAMAMSDSWPLFIRSLQRIRYHNGQIGVVTRNHYTDADWIPSNKWLVKDITAEIAQKGTRRYTNNIDRAKFLRDKFRVKTNLPTQAYTDVFLPIAEYSRAAPYLKGGDLVAFVRAIVDPDSQLPEQTAPVAWIGHLGLIADRGADGLNIIHAAQPAVREEPLAGYLARIVELTAELSRPTAVIVGLKFLRLEDDPIGKLRLLDGNEAPKVFLPNGSIWKIK